MVYLPAFGLNLFRQMESYFTFTYISRKQRGPISLALAAKPPFGDISVREVAMKFDQRYCW